MIPAAKIRERARRSMSNNIFGRTWLKLILCAVIAGFIVGIPSIISSLTSALPAVISALITLPLFLFSLALGGPVEYGLARIYLNVARGNKEVDVKDTVVGFKESFVESAILGFMRNLYIFLWSLLLIIPGIVKMYSYSMAFYIMQDAGGKKNWKACLEESQQMMDGYKGKLFWLDLTFIGWYIVGSLCLGVGALWVVAYHQEARAHFYQELLHDKYGLEPEDFLEEDEESDDYDKDDVYEYGDDEDDENVSEDFLEEDIYDYESDEDNKSNDD